jgi:hypothetical protein
VNVPIIARFLLTVAVLLTFVGCYSAKDESDAKTLVDRVHEQIRVGDYSALYNESAQRFKEVGSEVKFVEVMRQHRTKAGALKKAFQVAYETGVDSNIGKIHVFMDELEFENGRVKERLTLTRSDSEKMQLWKLEWSPLQ